MSLRGTLFLALCCVFSLALNLNLQSSNKKFLLDSKYSTAPMADRSVLGGKLTLQQRKYSDLGRELRTKYLKKRLLTEEEEKILGKISHMNLKIERMKEKLCKVKGVEDKSLINNEEISAACNIDVQNIEMYEKLSNIARNRLVEHNIRLVDYWVRKFIEHSPSSKEISYYELVVEGLMGLTKASLTYDGRGKFSHYCQVFIRDAIYRGLIKLKPGSYIPYRTMMINNRANKLKLKLSISLDRSVSDSEVAKALSIRESTLKAIRSEANMKVLSGNALLQSNDNNGGDRELTYLDLFFRSLNEQSTKVEGLLHRANIESILSATLDPTEKRTLSYRFGLFDGIVRSSELTAELMCMSNEGVRKIIIKSLDKLRKTNLFQNVISDSPSSDAVAPLMDTSSLFLTTSTGNIGMNANVY
jgi:DNA-directed RNA polymerase specialized sigma subunit